MDDELVSTILNNLQKFENSMRFTNSNYTLNKLAKELKTNSSYLSKIINDHKGQNFPNYLKTLRIDLAIDRLKSEPQFRDYTIQAIAEEVGFKTAQLFSATFHKKTGIYPSYFIKQLEKHIK
jgi:AraC-like DNA-binding protein